MRLALLVALLASPSISLGQGPEWERYQSKSGQFSVAFPGTPVAQTQRAFRDDVPPLQIVTMKQRTKAEPAFVVMFRELSNQDKKGDPAEVLAEKEAGIVARSRGTVQSQKNVTLDGHPGREFIFLSPSIGFVRNRLYLANGMLYHQAYFSMSREAPAENLAGTFFDSFALTK